MENILKSQFQLDPKIIFLNHGSFGSTPFPVLDAQKQWRDRLERQPVQFLGEDYYNHIHEARSSLADYIDCNSNNIVYTVNPTTAISMIIPSLKLNKGDEILSTDHEYGAMIRTWDYHCRKIGAKFIQHPIKLPIVSKKDLLEQFFSGVSSKTKIIFISQMTSPTALIFPVKEICDFARDNGILSIIDGAHIPGHCQLSISDLNPDIYTGACHKWMCAPKGSAFLYVNKDFQKNIEPFIVSWGFEPEEVRDSKFLDYFQWMGTCDPSAWLATPDAIKFQKKHKWKSIQKRCHLLLSNIKTEVEQIFCNESISPNSDQWYRQMAAIEIPTSNIKELKSKLLNQFSIEVPLFSWKNKAYLRISIQAYNNEKDGHYLIETLKSILKTTHIFNNKSNHFLDNLS